LAVVLPLYGAGVAWTLVYDTIYAHQDVVDDARVGVRSTALHFGASTQRWLAGFGAAMVAGLSAAGYAADVGPLFYAGVAGAGMHLAHQARACAALSFSVSLLTRTHKRRLRR
jgi:4-hydroxybenzoate polyprenyltransferase